MNPNEPVTRIFKDKWGRWKITPRHESAIQVLLEKDYTITQVKDRLSDLKKQGLLTSRKKSIMGVGSSVFYFPKKFDNIRFNERIDKKIENTASWIKRYSEEKRIKMIGDHLHDLVRAELRANNFQIKAEKNVKEFEGKKWDKTEHSLDIIAKHKTKELVIGLEIKNTLYPMTKAEIATKIKMCDTFEIIPVFAARWLEMHREFINSSGGFLWQFERQFYPRGQEKFVKNIRKRFKFPVEIAGNLPPSAIKDIDDWIASN